MQKLKNKSKKELKALLDKKREKLLELRSEKEMGHLKKTHLLKKARKDVARILTELNQNDDHDYDNDDDDDSDKFLIF